MSIEVFMEEVAGNFLRQEVEFKVREEVFNEIAEWCNLKENNNSVTLKFPLDTKVKFIKREQ